MVRITHSNTHMGSDDRIHAAVLGTPENEYETTFDSYLTPSYGTNTNYRLKILLRVHLKPDLPHWTVDTVARQLAWIQAKMGLDPSRSHNQRYDNDKRRFATMSWKHDEWQIYVGRFTQQALAWNRKFWLIPPPSFTLFDYDVRGNRLRPNVECEFQPSVVSASDSPHTTVEVINLHVFNAYFRSDSRMMASADVLKEPMSAFDPAGVARELGSYSAVAHEVGHMLGLPHIGVSRELPHCQLSIMLDEQFEQDVIPAMWKGGSNGKGCYGHWGAEGDAENVMGIGDQFASENAQPWLTRLPAHLKSGVRMSEWRVSLTMLPPQPVLTSK